MEPKTRWGIVGLGGIAKKFASDLKWVPDAELVAVGSRNLEKAQLFAKEYGAPEAFGSYDELFDYDGVDVLYIATPHDSHAELSIAAMRNGKHVLCEKPAAVNAEQLEKILAVSKDTQKFWMEALWSRFNPSIQKVKELADSGAIGEIGYINADFTFYGLNRGEETRLLNTQLAGGSLLDIGIYPLFLSYLFLGMPDKILADGQFFKTGVEINTSMILVYKNAHAVLHSGLNTNLEVKAKIAGSEGSLSLHPMWHVAQGYSLEKGGAVEDHKLPTTGLGYSHEVMEVHNCLKAGKLESDLWSHQNSRDLMTLLDAVRGKIGASFPFEDENSESQKITIFDD